MKLELINEPQKVSQPTIIADLEDTMITIGKRSRLFPVIDSETNEHVGYYLIGDLYLGADTIVITERGAIGDPIEKLAREAFVSSKKIDLVNVKPTSISEKDFRKIELQAFRNFQKMKSFQLKQKKIVLNGNRLYWPRDLKQFEFFTYLFEPETFILIKDKESLIAMSEEEQAIVICNKRKNSYIEISKSAGVKISNKKGEIINAHTTKGLIINGKSLNEILLGVFDTLRSMFK